MEERLHDGARPVPEAVRLVAEVAEGLAATHARGLVLRDVKPGNILVERSSGQARLTDFGLEHPAVTAVCASARNGLFTNEIT